MVELLLTQLVAGKLIAACNTHVQKSGCGLIIHPTPKTHKQKPKNCLNKSVLHTGGLFCSNSSLIIACTCMPSQTRKGRCLVLEELFDMYNIQIHHIVFNFCATKKGRRNKMIKTRLKFSRLVFSILRTVSRTYGEDLAIEWQRDVNCNFVHFFALFLVERFSISAKEVLRYRTF